MAPSRSCCSPGSVEVAGDDRLSVVVITRNRRQELERTLAKLLQLPERPVVYVIDNGSTDGTATLLRRHYPEVILFEPGRNLGAAGRNLGVTATCSPYVAFCDDDTWWSPGALAHAADVLDRHPAVAVLTAHIVVEPQGVDDPICEDLRSSPVVWSSGDLPGAPLVSFLAGASVVRRRAFQAAGGFEPRLLIGGEEELLASNLLCAGWAVVHLPEIEVHHHPSVARDPHLRRRQGIRNTLWFTWLRRPLRSAVVRTVVLLRRLPRDGVSAAAVAEACRGLPWVLRERQVVPRQVERMYASVDRVQFRSGARRYVS